MRRVLLADDNRLNQIVAAGTLAKLGYDVVIVDDGRAAVGTFMKERFDAVLMDVMMPDIDGYEATACMRAHERAISAEHVPVIGLSARAMEGDRAVALEAGMDDYLTKPLREDALTDALHRWTNPTGPASEGPATQPGRQHHMALPR